MLWNLGCDTDPVSRAYLVRHFTDQRRLQSYPCRISTGPSIRSAYYRRWNNLCHQTLVVGGHRQFQTWTMNQKTRTIGSSASHQPEMRIILKIGIPGPATLMKISQKFPLAYHSKPSMIWTPPGCSRRSKLPIHGGETIRHQYQGFYPLTPFRIRCPGGHDLKRLIKCTAGWPKHAASQFEGNSAGRYLFRIRLKCGRGFFLSLFFFFSIFSHPILSLERYPQKKSTLAGITRV